MGASGAGIANDGTLTSAAIGEVIVAGDIAAGAVDTAELASGAVTDAKLDLTTPALGTPASGVVTNLSGSLPVGVTGGSGLDDLPNKHNKCISRASFTAYTTSSSVNPVLNWTIANMGNSDEIMVEGDGSDAEGIFHFPSTGIWHVSLQGNVYVPGATVLSCESVGLTCYISTNNGGSYISLCAGQNNFDCPANDWWRAPMTAWSIVDVTNVTAGNAGCFKIKFGTGSNPSVNLYWDAEPTNGAIFFRKLGET